MAKVATIIFTVEARQTLDDAVMTITGTLTNKLCVLFGNDIGCKCRKKSGEPSLGESFESRAMRMGLT